SIAALPGMLARTILVDGFSKAYAMTGWRLGWGLFPAALAPHAIRLVINSNTCTAAFVQEAGIAALRGPQDVVDAMVAQFRKRRDALVSRLGRIPGVRCHAPAGAFYAFPDVRGLPIPAAALADRLLEEEGVALLDAAGPGRAARRRPGRRGCRARRRDASPGLRTSRWSPIPRRRCRAALLPDAGGRRGRRGGSACCGRNSSRCATSRLAVAARRPGA